MSIYSIVYGFIVNFRLFLWNFKNVAYTVGTLTCIGMAKFVGNSIKLCELQVYEYPAILRIKANLCLFITCLICFLLISLYQVSITSLVLTCLDRKWNLRMYGSATHWQNHTGCFIVLSTVELVSCAKIVGQKNTVVTFFWTSPPPKRNCLGTSLLKMVSLD